LETKSLHVKTSTTVLSPHYLGQNAD